MRRGRWCCGGFAGVQWLCRVCGSICRLLEGGGLVWNLGLRVEEVDGTLLGIVAGGKFVDFWGVALGWFVLYWGIWNH